MTPSEPKDPTPDIAVLEPVVRRVIAARVADPHLVDDLVQETLARVLESRRSLEGGVLLAYAVVSARNLVVSEGRSEHRRERLKARSADLSEPQTPEDAVVANEERKAVRHALRQLSHDERASLLAREVEGKDHASLARELEASPGAVSLRLFRARAKLRVEYALALCRVQPPTPVCRPVLLALSAGDRRRQQDLDAAGHLLSCDSCAALSQDLIERQRPLPAVWPLLPLVGLGRWIRSRFRRRRVQRTTVGATAAALAIFLVANSSDREPPLPQTCGGTLTMGGETIALSDTGQLAEMAGGAIEGNNLPVESVPANEGFWLGCADGRVWIQLVGEGESGERFASGQRLDFSGTVVLHPDDFPTSVGVDQSEGADELGRQRVHVEVLYRDAHQR